MGTYRGEAVRVSHRRSPWAVVLLNSLAGPLMQDSSEGKGQSAKLGKARGGDGGTPIYQLHRYVLPESR